VTCDRFNPGVLAQFSHAFHLTGTINDRVQAAKKHDVQDTPDVLDKRDWVISKWWRFLNRAIVPYK
jgi:hypothetical protein